VDLATALRALPKAELHLHLDGSVRPATAVELAAEEGMPLTLDEASARLIAPARCRDQAELLTYFDLPIALLQTREALSRVTRELVSDLADDGVRYAEIRWAPRLHLTRGLSVAEVIGAVADGASEARRTLGARAPLVGLIVTAMRSHPPGANVELARTAAAFGTPVIGFDLAGPEATYPAPPHAAAFRAAEAEGLALTAHAGEVPGPQRIREAVDLGVRRIAHGATAIEDPGVVELLRRSDITLDLCPTSTVQAGIVADIASHPLAALHRAGVSVTISTDDRTVSNVTLTEEMASSARLMGLSSAELAAIASNAFTRAFSPPSAMHSLANSADEAWREWAATAGAAIS
jgi:adenosine deaminase